MDDNPRPMRRAGVSHAEDNTCPTCGLPVIQDRRQLPPDRTYVGPAQAATILGLSVYHVRHLDDELQPLRGPTGNRLYDLAKMEALALTRRAGRSRRPPAPIPPGTEWLDVGQVARLLHLSPQRVRDMDAVLKPERVASSSPSRPGPRRYHRSIILAELERRGRLPNPA